MYTKSFMEEFSNFNYVLKLLKRDSQFNHNCRQVALKEGESIHTNVMSPNVYLIQEGYTKLTIEDDDRYIFFLLSKRGEFPLLLARNDIQNTSYDITALSDCILWEIKFDYLKNILLLEDPKNLILINYLFKISLNHSIQLTLNSLSAEERVFYMIHLVIQKFGIQTSEGEVILPSFMSYDKLSILTHVSAAHVANIIKEFQKSGAISIQRKKWTVKDVKGIPVPAPYNFDMWI